MVVHDQRGLKLPSLRHAEHSLATGCQPTTPTPPRNRAESLIFPIPARAAITVPDRQEIAMPPLSRRAMLALILAAPAAACGRRDQPEASRDDLYPNETPKLRAQIEYWSGQYDVPVDLVQRIVIRESNHIPGARNGRYYGLMQIDPRTAQTMGFRGPPAALLDADTNLQYGVKYLRGAWLVSDGDMDEAVHWYASGYYYEAKRKGLLEETGLRPA